MRRDHVVGLHERLLGDLPVAVHHLGDVRLLVSVLQRPTLEMGAEITQVILERRRVEIHVDEDEATPRADEHLGQPPFVGLEPGEVPLTWHLLETSVEFPREAVECAPELGVATCVFTEPASAVGTDVVECLDLLGRRSNDEQRSPDDVVGDVVPDLGNVFLAARHLPHLGPHLVDFELVELGAGVPLDRHVGGAGRHGREPPQHAGDLVAVAVEQLLIGQRRWLGVVDRGHSSASFWLVVGPALADSV